MKRIDSSFLIYLIAAVWVTGLASGVAFVLIPLLDHETPSTTDLPFLVFALVSGLACLLLLRARLAMAVWMDKHPGWILAWTSLYAFLWLLFVKTVPPGVGFSTFLHTAAALFWLPVPAHMATCPGFWKRTLASMLLHKSPGRPWPFFLMPFLSTTLFYLLLSWFNRFYFNFETSVGILDTDWLLFLLLAFFLLSFSRRMVPFLVVQFFVMGALLVGSAVKISFLGTPISPDDLSSLKELLLILTGADQALVVAAIGIPLCGFLFNFRFHPITSPVAVICLSAFLCLLFSQSRFITARLDKNHGNVPWNQTYNVERQGVLLHFIHESARRISSRPGIPSRQRVREAAGRRLAGDTTNLFTSPDRNVYLIVLESFWDPSLLTEVGLDRDPFHPRFRKLWEECGNSRALSPTAFGSTPNAEFELLTSVPYFAEGVVFEQHLRRRVPGLPALLAGAGYQSIAFHPNVPGFWNRHLAYQRIGFQRFVSKADFELNDTNGQLLSDESLFHQVQKYLEKENDGKPLFAYIMTITGHYDYPLDENLRPPVIHARNRVVERYANSIYYTSGALADFIEKVLADDPDALIVATGDHLPYLGKNHEVYSESGLLTAARDRFDETMYFNLTATPLVIVDGNNGPLAAGDLPMFEVPRLMLRLLGVKNSVWMDLFASPEGTRVRPLNEADLVLTNDGDMVLCRRAGVSPEPCADVSEWRDDMETLSVDILMGRQHVLNPHP